MVILNKYVCAHCETKGVYVPGGYCCAKCEVSANTGKAYGILLHMRDLVTGGIVSIDDSNSLDHIDNYIEAIEDNLQALKQRR